MKRDIVAIMALMLCFACVAYAEQTSSPDYTSKYLTHTHDYNQSECDPNIEYGPGIDVVVYQADPMREGSKKLIPDEITVESKYDFGNKNASGYIVAKYNLWELLKKKDGNEVEPSISVNGPAEVETPVVNEPKEVGIPMENKTE